MEIAFIELWKHLLSQASTNVRLAYAPTHNKHFVAAWFGRWLIWWHSGSTNTWFWLNSIQRTFLRRPFPADVWKEKIYVPIRVRRWRQIVQDQFFAIFRIMFFLGPAKHILGHVRSTFPWFTVLVSWHRNVQSVTKNGWLAINWYIWPICFETHCCWGSVAKQLMQLHYKITQSCTLSSHQVCPSSKCAQHINGKFGNIFWLQKEAFQVVNYAWFT